MFSIFSQFIFGNSSFFNGAAGAGSHGPDGSSGSAQNHQQQQVRSNVKSSSWKDKSLCFDLRSHDLELSRGEQLIGCFYPIEDVKGNSDELGLMKVTNLRLIWICCRMKRVNLSIGWRTVSLVFEQNLKDALGGSRTSLFVLTKYESTKYEFVFNKLSYSDDVVQWAANSSSATVGSAMMRNSHSIDSIVQLKKFHQEKPAQISHLSPDYLVDPFEVVFKVWQAYKQTQLFRHCRSNLTHMILSNKDSGELPSSIKTHSELNPGNDNAIKVSDVNKLPSEEIIEIFPGLVQSESRSIRYTGTLMLSNIRIIWIDESLPLRNMSIPYIRSKCSLPVYSLS